jgi:hypothetical protein
MSLADQTSMAAGVPAAGGDDPARMNRSAQLIITWTGFLMLGMILFGMLFGRYLFPWTAPHDSAEKVAQIYSEHADRIRISLVFVLCGFGLIAAWGACLAAQTRRKEGLFPVLTYCQIASMAVGSALLMAQSCLWATAAFRPGETSPAITQALNDAGYIMLLSTWMPFATWAWALGLSILLDRSDNPVYPRWAGWLSIWAGLLDIPGNTVWFFKEGAFGWQGAICLYTPIGAFGIWVATFTVLTLQNVRGGLVHRQELEPTG